MSARIEVVFAAEDRPEPEVIIKDSVPEGADSDASPRPAPSDKRKRRQSA